MNNRAYFNQKNNDTYLLKMGISLLLNYGHMDRTDIQLVIRYSPLIKRSVRTSVLLCVTNIHRRIKLTCEQKNKKNSVLEIHSLANSKLTYFDYIRTNECL